MIEFPFEKDIVLENEKVRLTPLLASDIDHLLVFATKETSLWQYSLSDAAGPENMQRYLDNALAKRKARDSYPFIVFDKISQQNAGSTRFYDYQKTHNTVQLGFTWYGKAFWGTHVNKNCKFLMLEFAFDHLGLERVEFRADNSNKRSIAAMQSIGCTVEGVLRSNCAAHRNGRRDSIILSILKHEWDASIKSNLLQKIS